MKKIAFTQRLIENESYPETRDALDIRWAVFCQQLGVLPVILPTAFDYERYFEEFAISGIVFTGGNDLSSVTSSPLSKRRDIFETSLLDYAICREIPIWGICRGMQLIALHFGARLETVTSHSGMRHVITVYEGCRNFECYVGHSEVNSYHSYQVASLPQCLSPVAASADGTLEALQHTGLPIEAQMWHPERESPFSRYDLLLAQKLFKL